MRSAHALLRRGLAALLPLATACNAIVGVEDVSLGQPDAGVSCTVHPDFDLVVSNPATTKLDRHSNGGPSLLFLLNTDAKPDALSLMLYDNMGGHGAFVAGQTYPITAGDSRLETCGICLGIYTDFDRSTNTFSETFMALAQGSLTLTTSDSTRLAGQLQGLKLRHVDLSGSTTRDLDDGCLVAIDDVRFDMTYSQ